RAILQTQPMHISPRWDRPGLGRKSELSRGHIKPFTIDSLMNMVAHGALELRMRRTRDVEEVALARMTPTRGFSMLDYQPDVDTTAYPKPFATYNAVSPAVHNPLASARPTHSYR